VLSNQEIFDAATARIRQRQPADAKPLPTLDEMQDAKIRMTVHQDSIALGR
jgi:hypothetical protein